MHGVRKENSVYDTKVSIGRYEMVLSASATDWLLLIHVLPAKPDYLRVKIWRRLQGLGAVAVKNSVYVLPSNDRTREDFQWLQKEIEGLGGEASLCEARFVDGLSDPQLRALFNTARDSDYAQLGEDVRTALAAASTTGAEEARQLARRYRKRFDQIVAIDYCGAEGRSVVEAMLKQLDDSVRESQAAGGTASASQYSGKTWVTRTKVGVDRMASAWLIQRYIDAAASFAFVSKGDKPKLGEVRFDMTDAEFTHEGDRCTFEILLERFALSEPALITIGHIIHDLDLKDGKFREDETAGVAAMLAGVEVIHEEDQQRLRAVMSLFDALMAALSKPRAHARHCSKKAPPG
jgi:hypothetical protein